MNAHDVPLLVVQDGPLSGHEWKLDRDRMTLGRGEECDIVLPERPVSRLHLQITRDAEGFVLEDMGSKNGTFVNRQPLEAGTLVRLQDGDEIHVALCVRLLFVGDEATLPLSGRDTTPLASKGLHLDKAQRRVWINGREIEPPLSLAQYRLLEMLYDAGGRVVSRDQVVAVVWPDAVDEGVSEQAIDALVRRLRDRLAELDKEHEYVTTVRGHGFRLATK